MSAKPDFIKSIINIMPEDDSKAAVITVFEDSTFSFFYNIRKTTFDKFSDPNYFNVSNLWPNTKVAVEM